MKPKGLASLQQGSDTALTSAEPCPRDGRSDDVADGGPAVRLDAGAWLLRHRVTEPRVPVDNCDRPELIKRCALTERPVTLVMAPGGFGKTTVLAACCEGARAGGVPTAWLTLSNEDTAAVLDSYVAYAFEEAGLGPIVTNAQARRAPEGPYPWTIAALRALEARDQPCVLILDELERATDPACAALLGFLLRGAPSCLHVALSCRELPPGLDAAAAIFGAEAEVIAVDDLRFSPADLSRFFVGMSRSELAAAVEETAGWPIALRTWRAEHTEDGGAGGQALVAREIFENWIEGRLLAEFAEPERELLLDISLLDWVDAALADDVLEQPNALDGLLRMPGLTGLITRTGGAGRAYRMHPLLRRYCRRRRRRAPDRHRAVQRRIAMAMGQRHQTVAAMHHAVAADDPVLAGRLLAEAGAPRVWLQEGADQLLAADRLLTDRAVEADVRLALVRCIAQAVSGDLAAARRTFASAAPRLNAAAANGDGLDADVCLVRATLTRNGCESVGAPAVQAMMAEVQRMADMPTMPAVVRGTMEYGLCSYRGLRAEFDAAREHGTRARALVLERSSYIRLVVDFQCGQVAMAQGRTEEAGSFYRKGQQAAKALGQGRLEAMGLVLLREMDLERNRVPLDARDAGAAKRILRGGVDFGCHAAAGDLALRHALDTGGADRALSVLDGIWERALATGLPALERYLAGARVGLLAGAGRLDDAKRTWDAAALPAEPTECLDLDTQSWREMEVLSCARLRMCIAQGEWDAARRFAHALAHRAAQRGLVRTRLRAIALLIVLESGAGIRDEAVRCVGEYLALCARSGYLGALFDTGAAGSDALEGYVRENPDGALTERAQGLLSELAGVDKTVPVFRGKQREVLERLATHRDRDIAAAVGLTEHGVRYHVRTIFRKLDASGRAAAVRRARLLRILPPE